MSASSNLPVPFISGDETDALTDAKRVHSYQPGERKRIKRGYWRRARKVLKGELQASIASQQTDAGGNFSEKPAKSGS